VEVASTRVDRWNRIREPVLRIGRISVAPGSENGLCAPGRPAIDGAPEAQLGSLRLEARPGDVNVVAVRESGIGTYGNPRLVAVGIPLHDNRITPAVPLISGYIDLDRSLEVGLRSQSRSIEITQPIDAQRRVTKRERAAWNRRKEAARPGLASI